MTDYLLHHNANTHWKYPTSIETDAAIAAARVAMADFLGGAPSEIAFGANMTTLTFHLARALGRGWAKGDEVVVTELDHHANIDPWRALERDFGIVVRQVRVRPAEGVLDWDDFGAKVTTRTRLVAVGGASNAIGTINDLSRAVALARAVKALVFIDAVHYAPHALVDVRALGCDLLACSAYKFYGPHVGVLWGRHDLLAGLDLPKLRRRRRCRPIRSKQAPRTTRASLGPGRPWTSRLPRAGAHAARGARRHVRGPARARPGARHAALDRARGHPGPAPLRPAAVGAPHAHGGLHG